MDFSERLIRSAEEGNVDELYYILADDPDALERIDRKPVVNTPLHIATSAGHHHYALEIANFKPSLTRKLNRDGFSPMHLALKKMDLAKEYRKLDEYERLFNMCSMLTELDPELLRVKGKDWFTPLHLAAQTGDVDILVYFLLKLPSCIEDITVRRETVMHIAVKSGNIGVAKVLLGWTKRANKEHILLYKDEDGNTALQIATSTNQPEVMKLLIQYAKNSCNLRSHTAMDIYIEQEGNLNREVGDILRRAKAKRASEAGRSRNITQFFSENLSLIERFNKSLGIFVMLNQNISHNDVRHVVLVVATLIATSTYQAGLNPPGGYWQDNSDTPAVNATTINKNTTSSSSVGIIQGQKPHFAGEIINKAYPFFFTINSLALFTSLFTILTMIIGLPHFFKVSFSSYFLLLAYTASLTTAMPSEGKQKKPGRTIAFLLMSTIIAVIVVVTLLLDRATKSRRCLTVHMR